MAKECEAVSSEPKVMLTLICIGDHVFNGRLQMTDKHKPRRLAAIDCDRTDYERQFLRIACVGTNAEFSAAVARLARRGNLMAAAASAPFSSSPPIDDSGDQTVDLAQNSISKERLSWNS